MQHTFPPDYGTRGCFLVPIDTTLLSIVAGQLKYLEQRWAWKTEQDYEQGYNAIAELEACMTKLCVKELVESQQKLYRLIDSTFNGVVYSQELVNGTQTILPPIPPVPAVTQDTFITRLMAMENIRALNTYAVAYGETVPPGESLRELLKLALAQQDEWDQEEITQLLQLLSTLAAAV